MSDTCKTPLLVVLIFSGLLLTRPALAADVQVDCSGKNPMAFHSITDALNSLDWTGPHSITVNGPCRENVVVAQRDRITIQAVPGHTAKVENAADPAYITILIAGSRNITLDHLIIQGGAPSVYVTDSSSAITMLDCVVQGSAGDGLDIDMASTLHVENSTIRNNAGWGVSIANHSFLLIGTYPNQSDRITGNGGGGLAIDGSDVQLNYGTLTIADNKWAGISMDGGRLQFYGGESDTPAIIRNNNAGIRLNNAASATLWSAFRITNNGSTGISANGASSITFYETTDSKGKKAVTTISGHSTVGLDLWQSSSAQMFGAHVVRENGTADANPGSRGGISMEASSLAIWGSTSVSNNVGPGIRLGVKSDIMMWDTKIANNTEEGVRETNLSAGGYYNPLTFTGNGGGSLYCDSLSVAFGDAATIPGVNCANLTKAEGPRPKFEVPRR